MTTYAYMRHSTDKQDNLSQSHWLEQQSVNADNWFYDEGKTGKSTKHRKGLLTLLDTLKKGDTLYVFHPSRLSRDVGFQLMTLKKLIVNMKVKVFCVYGEVLYDTNTKVKALVDDLQLDALSAATKAGMQAAKAAGKTIHRPVNHALHAEIVELYKQGLKKVEIGKKLNVSQPTIRKVISAHLENNA